MFIKRGITPIAVFCLGASAAFFNCSAVAQETHQIATINGRSITQEQLFAYVRANAPQSNLQDPAVRTKLLQAYVGRELMFQDALKMQLDKQPAVQEALGETTRAVIAQAYIAYLLETNPVTEEMARDIYNKQIGGHKGIEYETSHILVPTEEDAKGVIARLKRGEDFGKVAQSVSKDSSAVRGGDIGWIIPEKYPTAFAQAVVNLRPGKYTTTPVKTDYGWHIIRVEANRPIQPPPFESVRDKIMKALQDQVIANHLADLQKGAKLEFTK